MTDIGLDAIEAAARKYKPGAWLVDDFTPPDQKFYDYVNLLSPATVLALVARVRQLEQKVAAYQRDFQR